ncbi:MAG: alpha/beta fold hydrolase [Pseudomonadota bacterium]
MAKANHLGSDITYDVMGEGPTVVLQHGLFGNRQSWIERGFTRTLQRHYQLVLIDSLGHGESAKPHGRERYSVQNRAGDIVAVLDDIGIDKVHYIGYSMGGWIGTGMARHHADRLHSLTIGGWDCKNGVARAVEQMGFVDFATLIEGAKSMDAEIAAGIEAGDSVAFEACWNALCEIEGAPEAIVRANVPTLLWCGKDDPYFPEVEVLSSEIATSFLETGGDHIGAMNTYADEAVQGLLEFLQQL